MIKLKHILVAVLATTLMYSCSNNRAIAPFDHEAQVIKDSDTLIKYLKNHYYDITKDSIKLKTSGKTSLFDDVNLKSLNVTEKVDGVDIDYKMFYYIVEVGMPNPVKNFPKNIDSVLVTYQGKYLSTTKSSVIFETQNIATWFRLDQVVRGWSNGLTKFLGGKNITNNGPITYENFGRGYLIFPSGLGYRNQISGNIPSSSSLIFKINLFDSIENTDHDNDGLASYLEVVDVLIESDPRYVDTDEDGVLNYLDADDDNDGTLTKDEDANGDGDPRNDFSDPNNPTLPDYLNPKIK